MKIHVGTIDQIWNLKTKLCILCLQGSPSFASKTHQQIYVHEIQKAMLCTETRFISNVDFIQNS